jgi:Icc-related predicted phosphoesterase
MKILHFSDSHGNLHPGILELAGEVDVVVCSGDLMPNGRFRADRGMNQIMQPEWLTSKNTVRFFQSLKKPLLFCSGNHDFVDPCPILSTYGVDAVNLDGKLATVQGVRFYGFPWIPYIQGEWAFEATPTEMHQRIRSIEWPLDVLVSHAPIVDQLSSKGKNGHSFGNVALFNHVSYEVEATPKAVLSGHCHGASGLVTVGGCQMSNAAECYRVVTI